MENLRNTVAASCSEKADLCKEVEKFRGQASRVEGEKKELKTQLLEKTQQLEDIDRTVKTRGSEIYRAYSDLLNHLGARSYG